ncbi:hypothetical protein VNO77_32918 [Canavalia gladiata]|uniref:Uncharacterized protein n=1 Tax=Canavalia gladiata TaxID=3824 RepID=A0AAN9KDE1_CANGL
MASKPIKRRKINEPPSQRIHVSSSIAKNDIAATFSSGSQVLTSQIGGTNVTIQQAKYFAMAQAKEDGCTGNYRVFDSPFAPTVPHYTHQEELVNYLELKHLQKCKHYVLWYDIDYENASEIH